MKPIPLAIDGANPLGFLAALGAVCLLGDEQTGQNAHAVRLGWTAARRPILTAEHLDDGAALVKRVAELAQRPSPDAAAARDEKAAKAAFDEARREERKKKDEINTRRLPRNQRAKALETEHEPLVRRSESLRDLSRAARSKAAPDPTVSIDLELKVASAKFAEHCRDALASTTMHSRRWVDFCASFGVESVSADRMEATPFALGSASGHQEFLGTAGKLMVACTEDHIHRALVKPWIPSDEGFSFRWDPDDDRRYALRAEDPTGSSNKPKTLWGANRLAFEALRLFPCMRGRDGIATIGWRQDSESDVWRWPLWSCDLSLAVIASLVASRDVWDGSSEARRRLRSRGVFSVFQTRRITVGKPPTQKVNFTPAVPV